MTIDDFLRRLSGVRRSGEGYSARCPGHDDHENSLSVGLGENERILLNCFVGCDAERIVGAMGLGLGDLFPDEAVSHKAEQTDGWQLVSPIPLEFIDAASGAPKGLKWKPPGTSVSYCYFARNSNALMYRVRVEKEDGGKDILPLTLWKDSQGRHEWRWKDVTKPRPLYGLECLANRASAPLLVTEGEKCAGAAHDALPDWISMTWPGGVKGVAEADWEPLKHELEQGRSGVLWPDNDAPGAKAMIQIADKLGRERVRIVIPDPAWPEHFDIADLIAKGAPREELEAIITRAVTVEDFERAAAERWPDLRGRTAHLAEGGEGRQSEATKLVELARSQAKFFHDGDTCFATLSPGSHVETHNLKSRAFRRWLSQQFFETTQKAANPPAINAALNTLAGFAMFRCEERQAFIRVAEHDGKLYLDLCDEAWRVMEIAPSGWHVVESRDCPVVFRRAHGMKPLPLPEHGGSVEDLRKFVNVGSDGDFKLVVAWLLGTYRDHGPYPILNLTGEQGSAKSTTSRVLRELIDPNGAALRAEPKEPRDLMIAANNGWVLAFDNLSRILPWLSDGLCRLATGGGFGTRELYSDEDEVIFEAQRPAIINGIGELMTRGDLADRALILCAPRIPEDKRQTEKTFYADFYAARPRILGALLDAVSSALHNLPNVKLERLPRMADFAIWVAAAEPAFGWEKGAFLAAYMTNLEAANELTLEASPITPALREIPRPWSGTASQLLAVLEEKAGNQAKTKAWPKSPRALSNAVRRIAPNLAAIGLEVTFDREPHTGRRLIQISDSIPKEGKSSSPASPSSPSPSDRGFSGDAKGDAEVTQTGRASSPKNASNTEGGDDGDDDDDEGLPVSSAEDPEIDPDDAEGVEV